MPKHHDKKHLQNGNDTALVTEPSGLLKKFSLAAEDETYCLEQLTTEGPKHKQAYAALLLQRMDKLVSAIEKSTGKSFTAQKGYEMAFGKHGQVIIPIALPDSSVKNEAADETIAALSGSPEHEGVLFNLLLQAIEWSLKNTGQKEAEN